MKTAEDLLDTILTLFNVEPHAVWYEKYRGAAMDEITDFVEKRVKEATDKYDAVAIDLHPIKQQVKQQARTDGLEEAAKVADASCNECGKRIAVDIRALKEKEKLPKIF